MIGVGAAVCLGLTLLAYKPAQRIIASSEAAKQTVSLAKQLQQNDIIREALYRANARPAPTESQNQERDRKWLEEKNSSDQPLHQQVLQGPAAEVLHHIKNQNTKISMIMLMDCYGHLVASTHETSDWVQSDEPKWQQTVGAKAVRPHLEPTESIEGKQYAEASHILLSAETPSCLGAATVLWQLP